MIRNWIDGAPADGGDGWLANVEPATGAVLGEVARSDAQDVQRAVHAARRALDGPWGRSTADERARLLEAMACAIENDAEAWARAESVDAGKPIDTARNLDIPRAVANLRFFAGAVRHEGTAAFEMPGALNVALRRPVGVFGLITPWNLPLYLLTWKVAPALACGNVVVAKPSELTPVTADRLARLGTEVGLPDGVLNVVHGTGPQAGRALVAHTGVDGVSFTGGTLAGAEVGAVASGRFARLSLELGGKNATIVFDDADMDRAVAGAVRAAFLNTGQICLCGSRIFVQRRAYDAFVQAFVAGVDRLRRGDPADDGVEIGALISSAHRDKVLRYVALAQQEGGRIATGGTSQAPTIRCANGFFVAPTVVLGLPPTARTASEEIFGPVVTVHPFEHEAEVVAWTQSGRYGLAASVWTRDLARAHRVASSIRAGVVWVNTWLKRDLRTPFGGIGDSGVGREGGAWSLDFYSETRNLCFDLEGGPSESHLQTAAQTDPRG